MRRAWPTTGCCDIGKKNTGTNCISILSDSIITDKKFNATNTRAAFELDLETEHILKMCCPLCNRVQEL
jgi:hypothetical protein